jgi:hypothetical protein
MVPRRPSLIGASSWSVGNAVPYHVDMAVTVTERR